MKTLFSQQHGMKEADWEQNGKLVFRLVPRSPATHFLQPSFFSLPYSRLGGWEQRCQGSSLESSIFLHPGASWVSSSDLWVRGWTQLKSID